MYFSYSVVSWYLRSPTYKRKTVCKFASFNGETTQQKDVLLLYAGFANCPTGKRASTHSLHTFLLWR